MAGWDWGNDKLKTNSALLRSVFFEDNTFDSKLILPRRCSKSYYDDLRNLLGYYISAIRRSKVNVRNSSVPSVDTIEELSDKLLETIRHYHRGFPTRAYRCFADAMDTVSRRSEAPYDTQRGPTKQDYHFYRMRAVTSGNAFRRSDIFHAPAQLRHVLPESRYSIAGYPSLYLTTSLKLAQREVDNPSHALASRFTFSNRGSFRILDLGTRPQDFELVESDKENQVSLAYIKSYLTWYPLLAASSFIRTHPDGSFADEYIIPQLLLQWVREQCMPPQPPRLYGGGVRDFDNQPYDDLESLATHLEEIEGLANSLQDALKSKSRAFTSEIDPSYGIIEHRVETIYQLSSTATRLASRHLYDYSDDGQNEQSSIKSLRKQLSSLTHSSERILNSILKARYNHEQPIYKSPEYRLFSKINRLLNYTTVNLEWLETRSRRLIGIRYFSCKDQDAPTLGRNYVFPTENCCLYDDGQSIPNEEGGSFCQFLNGLFKWTLPVHIEDFRSLEKCEELLIRTEKLGNLETP